MSLPQLFLVSWAQSAEWNIGVSRTGAPRLVFVNDRDLRGTHLQFVMEFASQPGNSGLVHIRSRHNNRYWRQMGSGDRIISPPITGDRIGASAENPVEDQNSESSTLFRPIPVNSADNTFRFQLVGSNTYLTHTLPQGNLDIYTTTSLSSSAVFKIIDWNTIVILPKHVAFRIKDDNEKFLSCETIDRQQYLRFSEDDPGKSSVSNEIFQEAGGRIRIINKRDGKFWRAAPDWIWADADHGVGDSTLFIPVKLGDDVIALRSVSNNRFCMRHSENPRIDCLKADARDITRNCRLEVLNNASLLRIENLVFHTDRARTYGHQVLTMVSQDIHNDGYADKTSETTLTYENSRQSTWNVSLSLTLGMTFSFSSRVPFIAQAGFEFSAAFSSEYQWGQTVEEKQTLQQTITVTVPPNSAVRAYVVATQASCDIPFSYTEILTLGNGQIVSTRYEDGSFNGTNYYNFQIRSDRINPDGSVSAEDFSNPLKVLPPVTL